MKNIYLILVALIATFGIANGQSFSLTNVYISGNPSFLLEGHATVNNNSTTSKDVLVARTVNNLYPGHLSYFCWFECYDPSISVSPDVITIPACGNT
jgi:hypothetical protein